MSLSKFQPALELALRGSLPADSSAPPRTAEAEVLFVFDECAAGLRRYLGSFGLAADATEDVLQDVFVSLFRHLQLGRPRDNLKGWVFKVGHNLALKQQQKRSRRRQSELEWNPILTDRVVDPAANPEEQLAGERHGRRLRAVLLALPDRDRHCLLLRAEGLSYREIATALGISLGSVSNSLTRAIARLAEVEMG